MLIALALGGCGNSSDVMEIPEGARTSAIQKKVDVQPRAVKSSKPGQRPPNGRWTEVPLQQPRILTNRKIERTSDEHAAMFRSDAMDGRLPGQSSGTAAIERIVRAPASP